MRLRISVVLLLFLGQCCLMGQDSQCGTFPSEESLAHFINVKKNSSTTPRSNEFIYVPIKFHAVANAEGTGRVRMEKILDQLCELNANFEPLGFRFYMKDGTVNEVNNNTLFSNPSSAAGTTKLVGEKNEFGKNSINIFITDNAGTGTGGVGTTLGYYDFNQDLIVLKKSVTSNNNQVHFVLGHELGHFFSLPHTFNGWDFEPWDGTPVTSTTSPGGEINELADGSNCEEAGDMICDTPADYNLGFGWDGCRDYDGGCTDPSGALLNPNESNFMGYFIGCDAYTFSGEQEQIIEGDYFGARRSYLRVSFTPQDDEVEEISELLEPADDSTTPFYNGVNLEWEPAPGAERYLVELTQGLGKFYFITDKANLFLTDLAPEKNYRWKVRPYSAVNTCTDFSSSFSFRTSDQISSLDELGLYETVSVYPNPSKGAEQILVEWENKSRTRTLLELFSITGEKMSSDVMYDNNVTLATGELSSGVYVLKISDGTRSITKKIMVNE